MFSERPAERPDGKEKQTGVRPALTRLLLSASAFLRWLKISASTLLIVSFFLPWASQVRGCGDDAVVRESISGLSLVVDHEIPEATAAPVVGIVILALAILVVGKRRPLLRSITSLAEAMSTFFLSVFIEFGVFFLSNFRERYGFHIALFSLVFISAASLTEVVTHFPLLKKREKAVIVIVILFLIVSIIASNLPGNG
jgi:hypothetical protein